MFQFAHIVWPLYSEYHSNLRFFFYTYVISFIYFYFWDFFKPLTAKDEISCPESLIFLWSCILRWSAALKNFKNIYLYLESTRMSSMASKADQQVSFVFHKMIVIKQFLYLMYNKLDYVTSRKVISLNIEKRFWFISFKEAVLCIKLSRVWNNLKRVFIRILP